MGPIKTSARRLVIVIAFTMTVLTATPAAALAAKPFDPFVGSYRSIDFDGSNQLLALGGPDAGWLANVRAVIYHDDAATVACGGRRAFAEGFGVVDGNTIVAFLEVYCDNVGNKVADEVITFTADPATTTLTDSYGVVWSRP